MRALCVAEYGRLQASIDLGGTLVHLRGPAEQRSVLGQIRANGLATIERVGAVADPYLLSHTHMTLAAAEYDLASIASDAARDGHVARGTRHAFDALKHALDSGTTVLSTAILPWALVVLTGGLRHARGADREAIQALIAGCADGLPREHDKQVRDRRTAARLLFEAQLLLRGAAQIVGNDRSILLRRVADTAREARRTAVGAGDRRVSDQARELLAQITPN